MILGGARSGKSYRALALAESAAGQTVFIATAEAHDDEMASRIARHQVDRGTRWETVEAPLDLCNAIQTHCVESNTVLVDCLTLWLSNVMFTNRDLASETTKLVRTIEAVDTPLILVSNEVGMGIVPDTPIGREFRDEQGRLNQRVAAVCQRVEFVVAGLSMPLKT